MLKSICVICEGYPYKDDMFFTFVKNICDEFSRHGISVSVISPQSITKHFFRRTKLRPVKRIYYTDSSHYVSVYQPYILTFGNRFNRLNVRIREFVISRYILKLERMPDVCYSHFWSSAFYALKVSIKYKIPLFVATGEASVEKETRTIRSLLNKKGLFNVFSNAISGVIAVSSKNMNESVNLSLSTFEKIRVIPNAIDSNIFKPLNKSDSRLHLGIPKDDFVIAFTGAFINRKGSNRLSSAISMLHKEGYNIKSLFIGKKQDFNDETPTCPGIIHIGPLPNHYIPLYLSSADVFVLPTLEEGCCNSIIEAMACGLPIISSDLDFNYDILDQTNSILIDPNNIAEIVDAVKLLYDDVALRHKLSSGALQRATKLTIKSRADSIIQFIENIVSKNKSML